MARQSGRLEALHSIWPDLRMLKQLGWEVQRVLEVEEGEHRSTKELVLELREVGKEVQVDSLQRKVEQLEEKLAKVGGKVRECL